MIACRTEPGEYCLSSSLCKSKASCRRWTMSPEGRAAAAKRAAVRTYPMAAFPNSGKFGWCKWCGGEIVHGQVRSRMWHDGREGEPNCKFQWQLHTDPRVQYPHLVNRDGEKCADCGEAPGMWLRGLEVSVYLSPAERATWPPGERNPFYREIRWKIALEIEHVVPLWSIVHLSDEERRPYFGPDNQKLRCVPCHKLKSKGETKARAKTKRQSAMRLDAPRPEPKLKSRGNFPGKGKGPKIAPRAFSPGKRALRSRNDLKRR